jgi:hypothetical protein
VLFATLSAYLIKEIISLGASVVTGSGNLPRGSANLPPYGYPALFGDPGNRNYIPDLLVVGSVGFQGGRITIHANAPWLSCYAPGFWLTVPDPQLGDDSYTKASGTSYGKSAYLPPSPSVTFMGYDNC